MPKCKALMGLAVKGFSHTNSTGQPGVVILIITRMAPIPASAQLMLAGMYDKAQVSLGTGCHSMMNFMVQRINIRLLGKNIKTNSLPFFWFLLWPNLMVNNVTACRLHVR